LLPATARQLFNATVAPAVDYASTVWAHASAAAPRAFNTIQKVGAKAVTGVFRTVAREVAEAEASLRPVKERHMAKAMRTWADLLTLPKEHPLQACRIRTHRRFAFPLSRVKERANGLQTDGIEMIAPYILPPWQARIRVEDQTEEGELQSRIHHTITNSGQVILPATATYQGNLGYGEISSRGQGHWSKTARLWGPTKKGNAGIAELSAIVEALEKIAPKATIQSQILIISSNPAVLAALRRPGRQSGQQALQRIYQASLKINKREGKVVGIQTNTRNPCLPRAQLKNQIRLQLQQDRNEKSGYLAKLSAVRELLRGSIAQVTLSPLIGAWSKAIDKALPGPHTRALYDSCKTKAEAKALAQLRTGASRLNEYLVKIKATESSECGCGAGRESVKHYLFTCRKWRLQRQEIRAIWPRKIGNVSFFLGGRSTEEEGRWKPELEAVRAAVRFATATGRLASTGMGEEAYLTGTEAG
jgi:hypothetical protein